MRRCAYPYSAGHRNTAVRCSFWRDKFRLFPAVICCQGGITEQTTPNKFWKTSIAVLPKRELELGHIAKATVFLKDMNNFAANANEVYGK